MSLTLSNLTSDLVMTARYIVVHGAVMTVTLYDQRLCYPGTASSP